MNIIELDQISKAYGSNQVLKDFSLCIESGEFICVTGESGSGKSTLLNIIGLLETCDSGECRLFGDKTPSINSKEGMNLLRYKISYLFQSFALINDKTVYENLEIALNFMKINKKQREEKILNSLQEVGLIGCEQKKINQLSGGEQQRVALARIILKPSELVLADEPTGSLDSDNRDKIMKILKDLNNSGKTILVVSHDKEVVKYADRQIKIKKFLK